MNKKIWILILCLIMVMTALVSCKKDTTDLSPAEHVLAAIDSMHAAGGFDAQATVAFNIDVEKMLASETFGADMQLPEEEMAQAKGLIELINKMAVTYHQKAKMDIETGDFAIFYDYGLQYDAMDILKLQMAMNNDDLSFKMPNFSDLYMNLNIQKGLDMVADQMMMPEIKNLDLKKYIQIMVNHDSEAVKAIDEANVYHDILLKHFEAKLSEGKEDQVTYNLNGQEKTVDVMVYTYEMDMKSLMDVIQEMADAARTDDNLKAYIKGLFMALMEELKASGDYVLLEIDQDELDEAMTMLDQELDTLWTEFFDGFDEGFEEGLDMSAGDMLEMQGDLEEIYDMLTMTVAVDNDNIIRQMHYGMDYDGMAYDMTYTINAIGDDVKIDDMTGTAIDVLDLFSEDRDKQIENVGYLKQFVTDAIGELESNEGIKSLIQSLEAFEELGVTEDMVYGALGMAKSYLMMFSDEDLLDMIESQFPTDYDEDFYDDDAFDDGMMDYGMNDLDHVVFFSEDLTAYYPEYWDMVLAQYELEYGFEYDSYEVLVEDIEAWFNRSDFSNIDLMIFEHEYYAPYVEQFQVYYPDMQMVFLGDNSEVYGENMTFVTFYDEDVAYLEGYLSALMTETGKIAVVSDWDDYEAQNRAQAFQTGAANANPNVMATAHFVGEEQTYDQGVAYAQALIDEGVDVIYVVANAFGGGVIDTCEANGVMFVLQDYPEMLMEEMVLSYEYVDVFTAADMILQAHVDDWLGDTIGMGIAEDVLYIDLYSPMITEEVYMMVSEEMMRIYNGEFVVEPY